MPMLVEGTHSLPSMISGRAMVVEDLARETVDRVAIVADRLKDDELVAAEPGDEMPARRLLYAMRGFDEQGVAGRVAERVVDHLELVEVEAVKREQAALRRPPRENDVRAAAGTSCGSAGRSARR